jgi:hypothetical protein
VSFISLDSLPLAIKKISARCTIIEINKNFDGLVLSDIKCDKKKNER